MSRKFKNLRDIFILHYTFTLDILYDIQYSMSYKVTYGK